MTNESKIILILCLSLCIFNPVNCFSESNNLSQIYSEVGISEKSRFYPNISDKKISYASVPELDSSSDKIPQTVIGHFQSDKGIEIKPGKITRKFVADDKSKDLNNKIIESANKEFYNQNHELRKIPNCTKDQTLKFQMAKSLSPQKEFMLFDILFIRKSNLPLDPELVFGQGVQIMSFDENQKSAENIAIQGARIPCLPYRMRTSSSFVFRDYGKNALLDYSKNLNGNGEFHETIKAKSGYR